MGAWRDRTSKSAASAAQSKALGEANQVAAVDTETACGPGPVAAVQRQPLSQQIALAVIDGLAQ